MDTREEIACPSCGEMILSVAKKCKHCGEWTTSHQDIPDLGSPSDTAPAEQPEAPTLVEVTVERPWSLGGFDRSVSIEMDDSPVAQLGNGKDFSFTAPQGSHSLSAKCRDYEVAHYTLDTRGLEAVRIAVSLGMFALSFSEVSRVRAVSTDKPASTRPVPRSEGVRPAPPSGGMRTQTAASLISCGSCQKQLAPSADKCPHCGAHNTFEHPAIISFKNWARSTTSVGQFTYVSTPTSVRGQRSVATAVTYIGWSIVVLVGLYTFFTAFISYFTFGLLMFVGGLMAFSPHVVSFEATIEGNSLKWKSDHTEHWMPVRDFLTNELKK